MKWEDQRYGKHWIPGRGFINEKEGEKKGEKRVNNMKRNQQCPSHYVLWTEENHFWLPGLNVEDALDLVMSLTTIEQK